jgi:hypothetical protein
MMMGLMMSKWEETRLRPNLARQRTIRSSLIRKRKVMHVRSLKIWIYDGRDLSYIFVPA